jgi:hypothetical protein
MSKHVCEGAQSKPKYSRLDTSLSYMFIHIIYLFVPPSLLAFHSSLSTFVEYAVGELLVAYLCLKGRSHCHCENAS